jgi:hypothetical protein
MSPFDPERESLSRLLLVIRSAGYDRCGQGIVLTGECPCHSRSPQFTAQGLGIGGGGRHRPKRRAGYLPYCSQRYLEIRGVEKYDSSSANASRSHSLACSSSDSRCGGRNDAVCRYNEAIARYLRTFSSTAIPLTIILPIRSRSRLCRGRFSNSLAPSPRRGRMVSRLLSLPATQQVPSFTEGRRMTAASAGNCAYEITALQFARDLHRHFWVVLEQYGAIVCKRLIITHAIPSNKPKGYHQAWHDATAPLRG